MNFLQVIPFFLCFAKYFVFGAVVPTIPNSCFVRGKCTSSESLGNVTANTILECRDACAKDAKCSIFTFHPDGKQCALFPDCDGIDTTQCLDCTTGYADCTTIVSKRNGRDVTRDVHSCPVPGDCIGENPIASFKAESLQDCALENANFMPGRFFTYHPANQLCELFFWCYDFNRSACRDCVSGDWQCIPD